LILLPDWKPSLPNTRPHRNFGAGYTLPIPYPKTLKKYSKTKPIQFEEFAACIAWWSKREANENAWCVPAAEILQYDAGGKLLSANLDRKNPNRRNETEYAEPSEAIAAILEKERQVLELMTEIQQLIEA
jgi:type I restriction enzyme M protein